MRIEAFIWNQDRVNHIAQHSVTPREFEEACFGVALVLRASEGENLFITCWVKLMLGAIYSQLSFSSRMVTDIQSHLDQ